LPRAALFSFGRRFFVRRQNNLKSRLTFRQRFYIKKQQTADTRLSEKGSDEKRAQQHGLLVVAVEPLAKPLTVLRGMIGFRQTETGGFTNRGFRFCFTRSQILC